MSSSDRSWLVLALAYLSVSDFKTLFDLYGDVDAIAALPRARLREAGLAEEKCDAISSPDSAAIDSTLDWLAKPGHHLVSWDDEDYPSMLREMPGPPLLLYVNGDSSLLQLPALAIVGSRNPTQGGARNAQEFARHLARRGFVIVSGMAQASMRLRTGARWMPTARRSLFWEPASTGYTRPPIASSHTKLRPAARWSANIRSAPHPSAGTSRNAIG